MNQVELVKKLSRPGLELAEPGLAELGLRLALFSPFPITMAIFFINKLKNTKGSSTREIGRRILTNITIEISLKKFKSKSTGKEEELINI